MGRKRRAELLARREGFPERSCGSVARAWGPPRRVLARLRSHTCWASFPCARCARRKRLRMLPYSFSLVNGKYLHGSRTGGGLRRCAIVSAETFYIHNSGAHNSASGGPHRSSSRSSQENSGVQRWHASSGAVAEKPMLGKCARATIFVISGVLLAVAPGHSQKSPAAAVSRPLSILGFTLEKNSLAEVGRKLGPSTLGSWVFVHRPCANGGGGTDG